MSTLTDALSIMAQALVNDSDINTLCNSAWGQSLTVVRRADPEFRPGDGNLPLVVFRSISRMRLEENPHYTIHPVLVGVFASVGQEPSLADGIYTFPLEAEAEELTWRVERILTQALSDNGIPPIQDNEGGDLLHGAFFVAGWAYNIQIRNIL